MPTKYTLICHVDQRWVKEWGGDGSPMKFCFGSAMGTDTTINVVAHAEVVSGSITVEWVEEYYIAASKHAFANGDVTSATNFTPIDMGEKYTVDRTWTDSAASPSAQAPANGFLFQNVNTPASAVVAKRINGDVKPIYISPVLLPPAGVKAGDKLQPIPQVAVWFGMRVDAGTMIENDLSFKFVVDMDQVTKRVSFSSEGEWSVKNAV